MNLAKFSVGKPTTVFIAVVVLLIVGFMGMSMIAIDLYPEINPPVLIISTTYDGAQPEQVEERITRPLESMLLNVAGLKDIFSTSSRGNSLIRLEFDWGEDLTEAAAEARDKIELVRQYLPDEAETPTMFKFNSSMMPIMYLQVTGIMDQDELRLTAEDKIVPLFEQVDGVAMASLSGGREQIILVSADQNRLDALGLTLSSISQVIASQNIDAGGGDIKEGTTTFSIKTTGEYTSLEQIAETVIMTSQSGRPIRIQDVATVDWGYTDLENVQIINGEHSLVIDIQKQSDSNSTEIADNVIAALPGITEAFPGVTINMLYDSTETIRITIAEVINSLVSGILLAVLVIFLFMRSFRSMLIIGISIPISLLVTVAAMYFSGLTLNLFTLTGLILGLGMIVDSSIVILENIYRYREKGTKLETSAISGAGEMTGAIVGSTLTTICVFLPMAMFASELDIVGLIISPLAFTIIISLLVSLVVAVTLVPVMAARFPKVYTTKQRPINFIPLKIFDQFMDKVLTKLDKAYRWVLELLIMKGKKSSWLSFFFILAVFAAIGLSTWSLLRDGINMAPEGEETSVTLNVEMKEGTTIDVTTQVLIAMQENIEALLIETGEDGQRINHYDSILIQAGGGGGFGLGASQEHKGSLNIYLEEGVEHKFSANEIQEMLREFFPLFPDGDFSFSMGRAGMSSSYPLDIKVLGLDLDLVMEKANEIVELLKDEAPYVLEPSTDFDEAMPQLLVSIDRQKAYEKGLNMYSIGQEIFASIEGARSSVFRQDGEEYDLYVRLNEDDRSQIIDLDRVSVTSPMGTRIPLSSFADTEVTTSPVQIMRENQQRAAHVQAKLDPSITATQATSQVMDLIYENLVIDSGIIIAPGGDVEEMERMMGFMIIIVGLAILLVFAVMASIFENLLDPFIIFLTLFTLPIGVSVFYQITNDQLSLFSVVGMIMLVGIIVNNGIVLVDYTNLLRGRGIGLRDAAVQAGESRLRPVLMTSLTTILGMVPMAFFPSQGSSMIQPIGLTVIGGMSFSTLLTLFIVPITYVAFENSRERGKRRNEKIKAFSKKMFVKLGFIKDGKDSVARGESIDFSDCLIEDSQNKE